MVKTLNAAFFNHVQNEVTTLCWCWRITRSDDVVLGFTNFDRDLTFAGLTYKASASFSPGAIAADNSLAVKNLELTSVLDDDAISENDLIGGLYDNAKVDIFLVNYLDLPSSLSNTDGIIPPLLMLLSGQLGEVSNTDSTFTAELRSKAQYLNQKQSWLTSYTCRYELGDDKCTVNLDDYTHEDLSVAYVESNRVFNVNQDFEHRYFLQGTITFTSGNNTGFTARVTYNNDSRIELLDPMPYKIELGDQLTAVAGCEKTREACKRFNNIINFGGEPDLPGFDKYLAGYNG